MNYTPHVASGALRRHSQAARLLVVLGAIALLALPAAALLSPQDLPGQAEGLLGMPPGQPLDLAARWRTALVSLLPVGCGLYALRQLWTLFGEYLQGRVFGMGAQGALMRFAWTVLAGALALPFARALMSVAASMGNPPGQRFVTLGLYWHDGLLVLLGVVLVSIAQLVGITEQNISLLKSGKVRGVRFDTLERICEALQCQPGDLLEWVAGPQA
jgi:DNA-binding Xre family transcriptional regulator